MFVIFEMAWIKCDPPFWSLSSLPPKDRRWQPGVFEHVNATDGLCWCLYGIQRLDPESCCLTFNRNWFCRCQTALRSSKILLLIQNNPFGPGLTSTCHVGMGQNLSPRARPWRSFLENDECWRSMGTAILSHTHVLTSCSCSGNRALLRKIDPMIWMIWYPQLMTIF